MTNVAHMTHDEHHRALVRRLAAEVKPKRPLWPVELRLGLWMALEVGVLAWVATHTSNDFMQKLQQPVYAIEVLFFAAAAVISAALALRSAIPGGLYARAKPPLRPPW
jgi:H+/Cl- antiporter ClcA